MKSMGKIKQPVVGSQSLVLRVRGGLRLERPLLLNVDYIFQLEGKGKACKRFHLFYKDTPTKWLVWTVDCRPAEQDANELNTVERDA